MTRARRRRSAPVFFWAWAFVCYLALLCPPAYGAGVEQPDADADGVPDSVDAFPRDPQRWLAGGLPGNWVGVAHPKKHPRELADQSLEIATSGAVTAFTERRGEDTLREVRSGASQVLSYDRKTRGFTLLLRAAEPTEGDTPRFYRFTGHLSWDLSEAGGVIQEFSAAATETAVGEPRTFRWVRGTRNHRIQIDRAGVVHETASDGAETDVLELGFPGVGNAWRDVEAAVRGPEGFRHDFEPTDVAPSPWGSILLRRSFPSLPPGVYRFSLSRGSEHTARFDTHAGSRKLRPPDAAGLHQTRLIDGRHRFHWAATTEPTVCWYRLMIEEPNGDAVHHGDPTEETVAEVEDGLLEDETQYLWWVEALDGPTVDLAFNRSTTPRRSFRPSSTERHTPATAVRHAVAYHNVAADGTEQTDFWFALDGNPEVAEARVSGPGGFSYRFDLKKDVDPLRGYLKRAEKLYPPGLYTFHIRAGGLLLEARATLSEPVVLPAVDPATCRVEAMQNGNLRFRWAGVDHPRARYYRVTLEDQETGELHFTPWASRSTGVMRGFEASPLRGRWRVEVSDTPRTSTRRHRREGPWVPFPFGAEALPEPGFTGVGVLHRVDGSGTSSSEYRVEAPGARDLRVLTPRGVELRVPAPDTFSGGTRERAGEPAPGLYRFTAVTEDGRSRVAYDQQRSPVCLPAVDFRTLYVEQRPDAGVHRISWAPVHHSAPLWYRVTLSEAPGEAADRQPIEVFASKPAQAGVCTVPVHSLPDRPLMLRVRVSDAAGYTLVGNTRDSVAVRYEVPGFDYSALDDRDRDGFADNLDVDDRDPRRH